MEDLSNALDIVHLYMDEVIIFSKDVEEHTHHVDEILTTLREAEGTFNHKKVSIL